MTQDDNITKRSPSYFEHIDSHFLDSPTLKSQKSVYKGARISKSPFSPPKPKIIFIEEMLLLMHKHIERIVNLKGDGNYGYQAVSGLLDRGNENHFLVHQQLLKELTSQKDLYILLYGEKEHFDAIHDALIPCVSGLVQSVYRSTRHGFSETFFPLWSDPPKDPSETSCVLGDFQNCYILLRFI